ncbi:hypothetical protein C7H19_19360 [Aphanothece hegewaldii CCALA 016]|uniref:Uncharacterized protein n=1 Tax=Aphanothece hegewaldii CCALA 016 TaxID=2107694 RepID=A0A2T1LTC2_9CHRO|nr:hypothetical protein C7H19_19360 [Aphanothece hegewaldii CCALA 016]
MEKKMFNCSTLDWIVSWTFSRRRFPARYLQQIIINIHFLFFSCFIRLVDGQIKASAQFPLSQTKMGRALLPFSLSVSSDWVSRLVSFREAIAQTYVCLAKIND